MARQVVDIGVEGNDGTGDSIRESFRKVNSNFQEIYAVVGQGGQITFTLLSDTPDSLEEYQGNGLEAYIPIVAQDASGIEIRRLASNSEETDGAVEDTVTYNVTEDGVLILKTANAQIEQDSSPTLGGPLDAANSVIANLATTQEAVDSWNSIHGGSLTLDDVAIDKKFADANYYKRQLPGERVNLADEPANTDDYTKTFTISNDIAEIPSHGITQASTGMAWTYTTDGDPVDAVYTATTGTGGKQTVDPELASGDTVYIRVRDEDTIEFYLTESDALETDETLREELRLKLSGGTGTQTIQNSYFDDTLFGNWIANEALPRKSVVRRQGDDMEGLLFLSDHPGTLAGAGTPTGPDDLQAVTKLYVDSQSTESSTNLFVSTQGRDNTDGIPPGRAGRSLFYSFNTIAAAARQAEEIQIASPFEPGPFLQDITYTEVSGGNITVTPSVVEDLGVQNASNDAIATKALVDANKEFIIQEVFAWIDQNIANDATTTVGSNDVTVDWSTVTYEKKLLSAELTRVINASTLDYLSSLTANILVKRVGLEFFSDLDIKAKAGLTPSVFESAVNRAREVVSNVLVNNESAPYNNLQDVYDQVFITSVSPDGPSVSAIVGNFNEVQNILNGGVFSAPLDVTGDRYLIELTNGDNDFVDQGDPQNRDLRVGKVIRGKTSGALGKITSYTAGGAANDTVLLDLLAPVEFVRGEELEFGNATKERNISIRVESGIYYEDFPIRLPENTSIVGDESRRCIVRPKLGASSSVWSDVYFYRDQAFDNLTGDATSVTQIGDTNLPTSGTPYVDPNLGEQVGYFGRHYLADPTIPRNVDDNGSLAVVDTVSCTGAATLIETNKAFVIAETLAWIEERTARVTPPAGFDFAWSATVENQFNVAINDLVEAVLRDIADGGSENVKKYQGELFYNFPTDLKEAANAAIGYVRTIWIDVLQNIAFVRDSAIDSFIGGDSPEQFINTDIVPNTDAFDPSDDSGVVIDLTLLAQFAFDSAYNPARPSEQMDCFMLNDAGMIRGVTVQGHGGFMAVLDPAGQILTKSPFVHNSIVFSKSLNRQSFRGGIFADAFCANTPLTVTSVSDGGFRLSVKAAAGSALALRKPLTPAPFYINGIRYQVNDIPVYDPEAAEPTAELVLDPFSGTQDVNGFYQGFQETLVGGEYDITLQTPGSRSVLTNDLTLINDLGYGVVASNGAIVELGSTFTEYCHAGYYAFNGSEIRSSAGGNSYGNNGLVAEGFDPNEVPDDVVLVDDIPQAALTFEAEVVLNLDGNVSVSAGDTITQVDTDGTGTVVLPTEGKQVYLKDVTGTFTLTGNIIIDSVETTVTPDNVDTNDYSNVETQLSLHFYDTETVPNDRGDLSYYHDDGVTPPGTISKYQITTVEKITGVVVDGHIIDSNLYTYSPVSRGPGETVGNGAVLLVSKTQQNSGTYFVEVYNNNIGSNYKVGDTFTVLGSDLNGTDTTHDATITVEAVNISEADELAGLSTGTIASISITGSVNVVAGLTPVRSGQVYRANFSTNNDEFNPDGLAADVPAQQPVMLRANRNFRFDRVRSPERISIRPSTAINFDEQSEFTYRAISFSSTDSVGNEFTGDKTYAGTNTTFDFVNLIVNNTQKTVAGANVIELDSSAVSSTTLGDTIGDTTVAISPISDRIDIYRLNNNLFTDSDFQPPFDNNAGIELPYTNSLPMVVTWQGKKHYVYNYREVLQDGSEYTVQSGFNSSANTFALVDLAEVDGVEITLSGAATLARLNSSFENVTVRQKNTLATGFLKLSLEESTVLKLFSITGTFNLTDELEYSYDGATWSDLVDGDTNVVTPDSVLERVTNLTGQATGIAEPIDTVQNDVITLQAGIQDGSPAVITTQISVCRATGHDFKQVGSGSYNDTNFPNVVLGDPINTPAVETQVSERDKGRVFYESTDENGFYKVGRYLTVDQGTGTVTFAANIALSDVDGIGFRRGVVVSEFSTDTAMTDNASDAVPTESATRGYIDRRLGFDQAGNAVTNPLGPSVITANGAVAMTDNLNLGGFTIENLAAVDLNNTDPRSAVPREYVDSRAEAYNKLSALRDVEFDAAGENQLVGLSGIKTIYILSSTLAGGSFEVGQVLTDSSATDNYGTIVGRRSEVDDNFGSVEVISFDPGPDPYTEVDPFLSVPPTIYHKVSGAGTTSGSGGVKSGPYFEVLSMAADSGSDITLTVTRPNNSDTDGGLDDFASAEYNLQIKAGVIENADVSPGAAIVQSKLSLREADTYTGSEPAPGADNATVQANLGLSKFNSGEFTVTRGYVKLKTNGIATTKLAQIPTSTVLGRSAAGTGNVGEVSFSDVINQGGGLQQTDFPSTDINNVETANYSAAGVLTRKGADDFTVIPVSTTGVKNSFVKTTNTGRIVAQDLAIGQNGSSVVVLPFGTGGTGLEVRTPGGGQILNSQGATNPKVNIPGNLDVGATGVTSTTIQGVSSSAGKSWMASTWARHSFIEAIGEGGTASTGIGIGAGSGKAAAGQVAIVTAKSSNNTSPVPFLFSSTGVRPDINQEYDIGTSGNRYRNLWIQGIDASGNLNVAGNATITGTLDVTGAITFDDNASVLGLLTVAGLNNTGSTTLGNSLADTIDINAEFTSSFYPRDNVGADSGLNIGSTARRWNTVYATVFDGTATKAQYADLAENYVGDQAYEEGTVLVFGGDEEVTTTTEKGDFRAAGVVSTNPAHLMNTGLTGDTVVALALQGRVPCKVIGKVRKGDIIVTSGIAGYGCVNNTPSPGTIIGKAVGTKDTSERGIVEVVVGR